MLNTFLYKPVGLLFFTHSITHSNILQVGRSDFFILFQVKHDVNFGLGFFFEGLQLLFANQVCRTHVIHNGL